MRVIFLDVDGVLNSEKDLLGMGSGDSEIFDRPLTLLKELVESTNSKIVISSSWRIGCAKSGRVSFYGEELFKILENRLSDFGLKIFDITPVINMPNIKRGDEIRQWLVDASKKYIIESFVILDDEDDMCEFTHTKLVQTSMETGMTEEHMKRAKAMLLSDENQNIHEQIFERLTSIWNKRQEFRFGQLIVNVLGTDPYYMSNKEILAKLSKYDDKIKEGE